MWTSCFIQKQEKKYLIHVIIFISLIISTICQQNTSNYGPYEIVWQTIETCKGPKQRDCGKFEIENVQNPSDLIYILDFPQDCPATTAKVVVSTKTNNTTKRLWNQVLNKPCEHFVLGPILIKSFNLNKNCKIQKGLYEIHLDFFATGKKFLGSSFFYGTYIFQTMSYNKLSNFFCVKTVVELRKP